MIDPEEHIMDEEEELTPEYYASLSEQDEEKGEESSIDHGGFLGTGFDYVAGDPFW